MEIGSGGFVPTDQDRESVAAWFEEYDGHTAANDVEKMADMAMFPLSVVSDDSTGNGVAGQWTREEFVQGMNQALAGSSDVKMDSTRTPHFLTKDLVVVITDATVTYEGTTQQTRYADLLVKDNGRWVFQTMVQGGWGDMLKQP
ncbi:nuclear transport factor 2 family protein [Streptosporangium soli]|nr:nuclear transport factor 2 family protein [Streptosporangium sp. KLBMP 9127]